MFALRGTIIYSESPERLCVMEDGYLICEDGISRGVFQIIPEKWKNIPIRDFKNQLIIPGLSDIHVHAPQYAFRGMGMDKELLDWLNTYTFPEEKKYQNMDYAKKAYEIFVDDLVKSGTTRACIFATIHEEATILLMDLLEKSGIKAYVGKVSMDRNCPSYLCEEQPTETMKHWLEEVTERYHNVKPIITPRFIPSCTPKLMNELVCLQKEYQLPLQSHLSENPSEIQWVKELEPQSTCYGDAYDRYGAFGSNGRTVMAHCVYSNEEECELLKNRKVWIAHCPQSNTNLASGIAPAKKYIHMGIPIGLGSDIAGGYSISILRAMADALQVSKLRWRLLDSSWKPLTIEEAFYMGTKGGGSFFGKVGSFEDGYEFDAIVLDDSKNRYPSDATWRDRLERNMYLSENVRMTEVYVAGLKLNKERKVHV